ncbi:hypothetical protein LTR37_002839 [Vermiconidia calcicola]|uniref:Uncharacterized protein n=1 Tax=Vermiconidia calcicola TaxID=1690605 RepID=A0ACC3NRY8_9PEZI|nr:hypothetical protein LTR37_002839 [Vermiconidia calcicola]
MIGPGVYLEKASPGLWTTRAGKLLGAKALMLLHTPETLRQMEENKAPAEAASGGKAIFHRTGFPQPISRRRERSEEERMEDKQTLLEMQLNYAATEEILAIKERSSASCQARREDGTEPRQHSCAVVEHALTTPSSHPSTLKLEINNIKSKRSTPTPTGVSLTGQAQTTLRLRKTLLLQIRKN